ncbi:hypothetical protein WA026_005936 [Henosepilachna vigintioctopunctata]|uniref:Endoplasmic reticulum lectin 1 n=1 Tax=Henosepilachna vigintioctopunctata TaxID=420089 RepID=A0AAW1U2J9_9CUCU
MMLNYYFFIFFLNSFLIISNVRINFAQHSIKGFDDTIIFDINWIGDNLKGFDLENTESMIVTSSHKEKYKCYLPRIQDKDGKESLEKYEGPSALELISPLFSQSFCSYRLESYWTYEVCHGKFVRQYHEDREGKKIILQEYVLGKWSENEFQKLLTQHIEKDIEKNEQIPMKRIENVNLPYLEIVMGNGTSCELNNNKPREVRALYVCYAHGKHDIYSLKETSTCQYEIIILSPLLCAHPKYKPKDTGEHPINCTPLDGSSERPYNLAKLKAESKKLRRQSDFDNIRIEFAPIDFAEKEVSTTTQPSKIDTSPVENFLSGKYCLTGGTGWWRYEFCYGKSVKQFHSERGEIKTSINLGYFDKEKHEEWLKVHPHKRPKPVEVRKQLSHLYSNGDVCDRTGKPRRTEVKLKCLEKAPSLDTVSLYLLEPRFCEYILGVESPLICNILSRADENGLVPLNPLDQTEKTDIIGE